MTTATDPARLPLHTEIVPSGYLLTTRRLRYSYVDDTDGCTDQRAHAHPEHVIFWPERGTQGVEVAGRHWSLATSQGLWVPAGTPHVVSRAPSSSLTAVYVVTHAWSQPAGEVRPVVINAALREMLLHLAHTGMPRDQRLRAQRVCLELIGEETRPTVELPLPDDVRIVPIARAILSDPADDRSIEDWAYLTSQSARTIARAFRAETGLTFSQWRTSARMSRAVHLLGEGLPVGVVARRVGYRTSSAFAASFHRALGRPPRSYLPADDA
ncbi:helix-turn-helix domain-containing protein [Pimelobacter simplex]|uniref:helix-turn-helix domain-containing protein n=1 Tax=Nocardioides simplex TaxID=2045 RepID=UPI003AAF14BC